MRLRQFTNGSKHRLDFLWRVDDAARHARIRYAIRSRGSDDALSEKTLYYLLRFRPFHVEADHAGGKIFVARRVELDTGHAAQVPPSFDALSSCVRAVIRAGPMFW